MAAVSRVHPRFREPALLLSHLENASPESPCEPILISPKLSAVDERRVAFTTQEENTTCSAKQPSSVILRDENCGDSDGEEDDEPRLFNVLLSDEDNPTMPRADVGNRASSVRSTSPPQSSTVQQPQGPSTMQVSGSSPYVPLFEDLDDIDDGDAQSWSDGTASNDVNLANHEPQQVQSGEEDLREHSPILAPVIPSSQMVADWLSPPQLESRLHPSYDDRPATPSRRSPQRRQFASPLVQLNSEARQFVPPQRITSSPQCGEPGGALSAPRDLSVSQQGTPQELILPRLDPAPEPSPLEPQNSSSHLPNIDQAVDHFLQSSSKVLEGDDGENCGLGGQEAPTTSQERRIESPDSALGRAASLSSPSLQWQRAPTPESSSMRLARRSSSPRHTTPSPKHASSPQMLTTAQRGISTPSLEVQAQTGPRSTPIVSGKRPNLPAGSFTRRLSMPQPPQTQHSAAPLESVYSTAGPLVESEGEDEAAVTTKSMRSTGSGSHNHKPSLRERKEQQRQARQLQKEAKDRDVCTSPSLQQPTNRGIFDVPPLCVGNGSLLSPSDIRSVEVATVFQSGGSMRMPRSTLFSTTQGTAILLTSAIPNRSNSNVDTASIAKSTSGKLLRVASQRNAPADERAQSSTPVRATTPDPSLQSPASHKSSRLGTTFLSGGSLKVTPVAPEPSTATATQQPSSASSKGRGGTPRNHSSRKRRPTPPPRPQNAESTPAAAHSAAMR